jgi:hypothetical protein
MHSLGSISERFFSETTWTVETKLPRNDHWKVLCFFMPIGNPRRTIWGKYRNIFFSEAIALIEPKLFMPSFV